MASLNKWMGIGYVGKDPEIKYTKTGTAIANFSLGCSEKWKKNGETQEKTEWVNLVAFDKTADLISKYISKGSHIYVEGKLQTQSWQDDQGNKKYKTEVMVFDVKFLDSKPKEHTAQPQQPTQAQEDKQSDYVADDIPF